MTAANNRPQPSSAPRLDRLALHRFNMPIPDRLALASLPPFAREVVAERARLAMVDPAGELDAVRPLGQVTARGIALEMADIEGSRRESRSRVSGVVLDERAVLDRLGADPTKAKGVIRCPAHEDRQASLSWRVNGDKVLLHCFAGCTFDEILAAA